MGLVPRYKMVIAKMFMTVGVTVLFFLVSNLVLAVDPFHPVAKAEEIRAVLFMNHGKEKCFLTQEEVQKFSQVLNHMKVKPNPPGIEHILYASGDFAFMFWFYSERKMDMVPGFADFNKDGSSSGNIVSDEDEKIIQALCKQLLMRAK
jgi:hypothetical protein